ncbi:sugar-phosphate isomerase, RpiB/LacA/LacB family [Syncephalis plumigaleata]|nr:sugar-phosphate isomerase, RpiB/LacA/LacB family [Syncephalis plumigaleata]
MTDTYVNSTVYIGSDHAGYDLKVELIEYLRSQGKAVVDVGCFSKERVDYPEYAPPVAEKVLDTSASPKNAGILVCGSGIGISIAANKINGIRCALCHDHYDASMARKHNDANIVALGGRTTGAEVAKEIVDTFLTTGFDGNQHAIRVAKIHKLEQQQ